MWGYATEKLLNVVNSKHVSQHVTWHVVWGPTKVEHVVT